MVAVDYILGSDAFLACLDGDGHTVFVASSHHHDVFSAQTHIARIDVGWYVYSGEMADMDGTVGVGESRGD